MTIHMTTNILSGRQQTGHGRFRPDPSTRFPCPALLPIVISRAILGTVLNNKQRRGLNHTIVSEVAGIGFNSESPLGFGTSGVQFDYPRRLLCNSLPLAINNITNNIIITITTPVDHPLKKGLINGRRRLNPQTLHGYGSACLWPKLSASETSLCWVVNDVSRVSILDVFLQETFSFGTKCIKDGLWDDSRLATGEDFRTIELPVLGSHSALRQVNN